MHKSVYFYKAHYDALCKFRKEKKITEERIIQMIAMNIEKYYGPINHPENKEQITVKIKGYESDFEYIAKCTKESLFPVMLPQLINNFMIIHKNDELRKGGKALWIYFNGAELKKLKFKAGDKKLSEYIKQEVLK